MRTIRVLPKARFDKHGARPRFRPWMFALALAAVAFGTTFHAVEAGPALNGAIHPAQVTLRSDPLAFMFANQP